MFIWYMSTVFILLLYVAIQWPSNHLPNVIFKMVLVATMLWTGVILAVALSPSIEQEVRQMKVK